MNNFVEAEAEHTPNRKTYARPDTEELVTLRVQEQEFAGLVETARKLVMQYGSLDQNVMNAVTRFALDDLRPLDINARIYDSPYGLTDKCVDEELKENIDLCAIALSSARCWLYSIRERIEDGTIYGPLDAHDLQEVRDEIAGLPQPAHPFLGHRLPGMTALSAMNADAEPFGSLIPGLLDRGAMSIVVGDPNMGKSLWAVDLAMRVASGLPWRGRPVEPGAVLYFAAEDAKGIKARARAWQVRHSVGDATPFAVLDQDIDFTTDEGGIQLITAVNSWELTAMRPIALVVIDTLSRAFGGKDENPGPDMRKFVANAERLQRETAAACMVLHHPTRGTSEPRGHGSLKAAADTVILVTKGRATVAKQRAGVVGDGFGFSIAAAAHSAVIEHEADAPPAAPAKPAAKLDPLPLLGAAVRAAADAGVPFKLSHAGGLHERRAELPAPLCDMGRDPLRALARAGLAAGVVVNEGGVLVGSAPH